MYPIIKNASGEILAIMNNITTNTLKHKINSNYTFDFKCFMEEHKSNYIQFGNVVEAEDQTFDIAYIDESHSVGVEYDVKCEHIFYRLIGDPLENYANTGTPSDILAHLLVGTEFSVGEVDFTAPIVFAVNQKTTKMSLVLALANSLGGEIGLSNKGFTIDIKQTLGVDNGYQIRIKKNLEKINKIVDRRGTNKATYKISTINVFKSDEMVLEGFDNLETLGLGDKVRVIDETINVDVELFVVEEEKDVIKSERINVIMGDSFENISDKISYIETQAIKQSDIIYGVKINNEVGIEIERADKMARTRLNADEFRMQKKNEAGSYIDSLYFNPVTQEYIFAGKLGADVVDAQSIQADAITADKIDVIELSAISANMGTINAGTINGITINGATINGGIITITGESPIVLKQNDSGNAQLDVGDSRIFEQDGVLAIYAGGVGFFAPGNLFLLNGARIATINDIPQYAKFG